MNNIINRNGSEFKKKFLKECKYTDEENTEFKVLYKKIDNLNLVLFGVELVNIKGSNYLPYFYYLDNNEVKFKKVNIKKSLFGSGLNLENKTFDEISKIILDNESYTTWLLNFPTNLNNKSINQTNLYNLKKKLENKISPPQLQQQEQLQQLQQQEELRKIQETFTQNKLKTEQNELNKLTQTLNQEKQKPPQMQLQLKINELRNRLKRLEKNTNRNQLNQKKEELKQNISSILKQIKNNPENGNLQKQIKNLQKENLSNLLKKLDKKPDKFQDNICIDPQLEVEFKPNDKIFFGYDLSLFVKSQNDEYKLYYKYSYHDSKFYELKKQGDDLKEEKITIESIPTYDILCLYEIIKNKNNSDLIKKLEDRITKAKQNISTTAKEFFKLTDSNFNKEKKNSQNKNNKRNITNISFKNFGKVKERRIPKKTYIFFGAKLTRTSNRSSYPDFSYVCFKDNDKVYYYERTKLNKKKELYEFPNIYPLEDLISFILLRRLINVNDPDFANIIYKEAKSRIIFLKTQKFAEKINKNKKPHNYEVTLQGLIKSKNFNKPTINHPLQGSNHDETLTLNPISVLPISPNSIKELII